MESTDIVSQKQSLEHLGLKGAKGFQYFSYARTLDAENHGYGKVQHIGVFFGILQEAIKLHLHSYIKENLLKILEEYKKANPVDSESEVVLLNKLINSKNVDKLYEQYSSKNYDDIIFTLAKFSLYYQKKQSKEKFQKYMKGKDKEWNSMYKGSIKRYFDDDDMDDYSKLYFRLLAFGLNVSIKVIKKFAPPKDVKVQIYMTQEKQDLTIYVLIMNDQLYLLQREDAQEHYLEQLIFSSLNLFTELIANFNNAIENEKYNKKKFQQRFNELKNQIQSALKEFEGSPYRDLRVIEESRRIIRELEMVRPEEVFELMNQEECFD